MWEELTKLISEYPWIQTALLGTITVLICLVAFFLARRVLHRGVEIVVQRTRISWDDVLVERGVFERLAWLAPALVMYYATFFLLGAQEMTGVLQRLLVAYMTIVIVTVVNSFLTALLDIYDAMPRAREIPIKGYVQVAKLLVTIVGGIIAFATILNRSPWGLLSGLGAATAVLLLVFKDTILSFVASIQIASSRMIRVGDWISMPKFEADGDVIDIALHRVLVQNWNKTITYIPTHKFLDEAFTNWRGMSESGGRRIKRAIYLDQTSVAFLTADDIERLKSIALLRSYLEDKQAAIQAEGTPEPESSKSPLNTRRLTNLGTFRAYIAAYLEHHPQLYQDRTLLVRQLDPGPTGIPMEIYVFSKDIRWANYESIQSDIFDHLLAALPEFRLRVFQNPTGADFEALAGARSLPKEHTAGHANL